MNGFVWACSCEKQVGIESKKGVKDGNEERKASDEAVLRSPLLASVYRFLVLLFISSIEMVRVRATCSDSDTTQHTIMAIASSDLC